MQSEHLSSIIIILISFHINGYGLKSVSSSCGSRKIHHKELVTNGFKSREGECPWHAAIYLASHNSLQYRCGGTLINSNSILTAAHCLYENSRLIIPDRLFVQLGKFLLLDSGTQNIDVYKIIPHPNYDLSNLSNDIAVVQLSTEAIFDNYVQPICLWDPNKVSISEVINKFGTVVGWGITETDRLSDTLQKATLPVVSFTTCLNSHRDFFGSFLSDYNFCAGFQNGTSICNGDSGGSMTFEENGVYRIRGIVSLTVAREDNSQLCSSKDYVLFTDVAQYLPWIEEVVPNLPSPRISAEINLEDLTPKTATSDGQQCKCVPYYKCSNGTLNDGLLDIRFDSDGDWQCEGYFEVCCKLPLTPNVKVGCGHRNINGVGFQKTDVQENKSQFGINIFVEHPIQFHFEKNLLLGEFPWTIAVLMEDNKLGKIYLCGGSLISIRVVLTVAHCVAEVDIKALIVRAGEWDASNEDERYPHQDRNVNDIIIHEKFDKNQLFNDIALLFLEIPVKIAENVNTVCFPSQDYLFDRSKCFVTGWGKGQYNNIGKIGEYHHILKRLELPVVPKDECENALRTTRLGQSFQLNESFICAGGEYRNDTCRGGGATLSCPVHGEANRFYQAGILAWVIGCDDETPRVFVNVAHFRNWIDSKILIKQVNRFDLI